MKNLNVLVLQTLVFPKPRYLICKGCGDKVDFDGIMQDNGNPKKLNNAKLSFEDLALSRQVQG